MGHTKIITGAAMSLDGYRQARRSGFEYLLDWYNNGDIAVGAASPDVSFSFTPENRDFW